MAGQISAYSWGHDDGRSAGWRGIQAAAEGDAIQRGKGNGFFC